MTFTFTPVVSTDNFTFVDGDGNTFSFNNNGGEQPFSFVQDSEGQSLTFVELSPNQTIGTVNNVINTYNQSGVDSDWILRRKIEEFSNVSDSDAIKGYALVWDSDKQLYSPAPAGGVIDSDFVQSVSLLESQLDGFTTTSSAGVTQIETAGGNGGFFNTSGGSGPIPGTSEKLTITLDSEWDAVDIVVSGGTNVVVTGNSGSNQASINLNGTYTRSALVNQRVEIVNNVFFFRTGTSTSNYYWRNATSGVTIIRLTNNGSAANEIWRFINFNPASTVNGTNVTANLISLVDASAGDMPSGITPSGTITSETGGGTATYAASTTSKLTYTFSVPSIPKTFAIVFDGTDTVAQATTKIANAWDSETPYTITTGTRTVSVDTLIDSDLNNATVAVTNAGSSLNATFGVRGTQLTITDGVPSVPGTVNTTKSIVSYRNVTYLVPLGYRDSEFFREFAQLENVDGVSFVYDSDNNKLIGTSDYTGFKIASALSVNHGGKDGTFAWDSDKATITTLGVSPGPSVISQQFFNTIYNEDRVIQTLVDSGIIDGTTGTSSIIVVRAESTTPTVADFGTSILLGEY